MRDANSDTIPAFLTEHRIHEVECVIPDMTGIAALLPDITAAAAQRLERALEPADCRGAGHDQAALLASRDALLALIPETAGLRA